jgi:CHAT domain-containing protein/Tfp pilus assembly protein PilF
MKFGKYIFWTTAMVLLMAAAACVKKPQVETVKPVNELGNRYTRKADEFSGETLYENANYYIKKAIDTYRETGHWQEVIRSYIKLGSNFSQVDDYEGAMKHYDTALNLALTHSRLQQLEVAAGYQRMARSLLIKGKYQKAVEFYKKALDVRLRVQGENHPDVARVYNNISQVYWNMGDSQKAREFYNKSLFMKIRLMLGLRYFNMVKKYNIMDRRDSFAGDLEKAKNFFRKVLKSNWETYGDHHPLLAVIFENMGIIHTVEGDYDQAVEHFGRSIAIRLEIYGENSLEVAISYHDIGICLAFKGDNEEALLYLQEALAIKSKKLGRRHPDLADTYYQLGKVRMSQTGIEAALEYFQKALMAALPDFGESDIYRNPRLDGIFQKDILLKVLAAKAQALAMLYTLDPGRTRDLRFSLETYELVGALIERTRLGYKSEEYKLLFGEKCHEIYDQAIQTALELYNLGGDDSYRERAFAFSEQSKAAVLTEALNESRAREFAGIPPELLEKEKNLKAELVACRTSLENGFSDADSRSSPQFREQEGRYFQLSEAYYQLIELFERDYPRYYHLKYRLPSTSAGDIQKALDPDTALVEYFVGQKCINIFVITAEYAEAFSVPIEPSFQQTIANFYNAIKKIEEQTFLTLAYRLHQKLIHPIHRMIQTKKRLIVIPHTVLYYVPFETLLRQPCPRANDFSSPDYLIKHFAFSYHYSAKLWLYGKGEMSLPREKSFVGFAPIFSDRAQKGYVLNALSSSGRTRLRASTEKRALVLKEETFPELLATERELQHIIDLFQTQAKPASAYFHQQATEEAFKAITTNDYSFVHIATHSLQNKENPEFSGLIFSPPAQPSSPNDGILYAGETYNLDLNAQLVVLGSCESGIGKLLKGEGMIALHRGFFYAGVGNIIFSLWKIEDKATSRLMIELYRHILADAPFADALRQSKLLLLRHPFTAFPKYWSGFILLGV